MMRHLAIYQTHSNVKKIDGDNAFDIDGKSVKLDETLIANKIKELENAEPLKLLRNERNAKLAETDWVVIKEREEGGSVSNFADWKTYRQALRDITDSATSLDDVTWPEKP